MFEATGLMVFYENMLALNNVSLNCDRSKIIGVFGANSAGKSTLMYCLSGIVLDIRKKEEMAGGERITIRGKILFEGQDVMWHKPADRARAGIILCPERRRIFPESTVLENLRIGAYLATAKSGPRHARLCVGNLSSVKATYEAARRISQRWRTTDACNWQSAYGATQIAAA